MNRLSPDSVACPLRVLALDPGSHCTGYAVGVMDPGLSDRQRLAESGLIRPPSRHPAISRILYMAREAQALIDEQRIGRVVIEVPDGRMHARMQGRTNGAGMSIYGMAVGMVYGFCLLRVGGPDAVEPVPVNAWTRGIPKAKRAAEMVRRYGIRELLEQDAGMDAADAIGVLTWWMDRRRELQVRAALGVR